MDEKKYDALEKALIDLSSGKDLSSVIAANPDLLDEIEAIKLAQSASLIPIPSAIIQRSRTQVLSRAMQLRKERQTRVGFFQRIPRLFYVLVLAFIFLISWNGLIIASAQALPGDQLYPAKITLEKLSLGLALNLQTHQKVEEEYQARRVVEVKGLLGLGRVEFVQFSGIVEEQWDDRWIVEGIDIRLLSETIIIGEINSGMTVEVEGATQPEGWVQASEIHLQNFSFSGGVETISEGIWTISGRDVLITSASQIEPDIQVGDTVTVQVSSDDFGNLTVRVITRYVSEAGGLKAIETPTLPIEPQKPSEDQKKMDEVGDDDETGEDDDAPEVYETPEPDESDESDDADKTDEPDESDESDEDRDDESDEDDDDERDGTDGSDDEDAPDEDDDPNQDDDLKD
jgi:hypothetical protein